MGKYEDDYYYEKYEWGRKQKEAQVERIISEFDGLSLEEKVNKLIKIYAHELVYG